jgi:hypothetical protein
MRQNIAKVIEAFLRGIPAKGDSKATCWTDGEIVYSYALPIARRVSRGYGKIPTIEIIDDHPTQTTRSQIDALRRTFPGADLVTEIPEGP